MVWNNGLPASTLIEAAVAFRTESIQIKEELRLEQWDATRGLDEANSLGQGRFWIWHDTHVDTLHSKGAKLSHGLVGMHSP